MRFPTAINRKRSQIVHALALSLLAAFSVAVLGTSMIALAQDATPEATPEVTPAATPSVGVLEGQIIYAGKQSGNFEIYAINEDGSNSRNLTNNRAADQGPIWSPDGTKIAFESKRDGNWQIYVMNPDGSNSQNLSHNSSNDLAPNWSRDGQHIAFASDRDGDYEIFVMNPDGSNVQQLTHNTVLDSTPIWTPDGKQIVYATQGADQNFLNYIVNADGSNVQRFLPNQPLLDGATLTWSPDGTKIAFENYVKPAIHTYVINADGTNVVQLTSGNSDDSSSPAWSPDGTQLVFVRLHANRFNLFVMNVDGSNVRQLTTNADLAQSPAWAQTLVFPTPVAPSQGTATVNGQRSVNMRSGAGTSNGVVASVHGGSTLTVIGFNADRTWVNVRLADGSEGWISAALLTVTSP